MTWIQHFAVPGLPDDDLRDYLRESHAIVTRGLTAKMRRDLGLA